MSNEKEGTTLRDLVRRLQALEPVDDDFATDLASIRREVPDLPAERPPKDRTASRFRTSREEAKSS